MSARNGAPGKANQRLTAYLESLAEAVGHADRRVPLHHYCTGLLSNEERKSVEPMAALVAPQEVELEHQSLLHFVGQSKWDDEALLDRALQTVLPAIEKRGRVTAWIVDDTGIPKKGRQSVGVARQYCGQLGKQENCQAAVSLSLATVRASVPVAFRLYMPEEWAKDRKRRAQAKVPDTIAFQTKPEIALDQIRRARERELPEGVVLADGAYGSNTKFRLELDKLGMRYLMGVVSTLKVWFANEKERQSKLRSLSVKEVAQALPGVSWRRVEWREGTRRPLASRFAARRIHTAHRGSRDRARWLLIEWPANEAEPTRYWLSNLPRKTSLRRLVATAKQRWIVGVSRQGHIIQSVRDRPGPRDSSPVAWEAPWRESKTAKPSDNMFRKEHAQRTRLQRAVNADVASLHANPVAETVYDVRRQQEEPATESETGALTGGVSAATWCEGWCGNWRTPRRPARKARWRGGRVGEHRKARLFERAP